MDLTSVFRGTENAKAIGGFTSRLGVGSHTLLLKRFVVKESQQNKGKIVEADFQVLESSTIPAGETKGWAWFIGAPGWAGTYEEARLKALHRRHEPGLYAWCRSCWPGPAWHRADAQVCCLGADEP